MPRAGLNRQELALSFSPLLRCTGELNIMGSFPFNFKYAPMHLWNAPKSSKWLRYLSVDGEIRASLGSPRYFFTIPCHTVCRQRKPLQWSPLTSKACEGKSFSAIKHLNTENTARVHGGGRSILSFGASSRLDLCIKVLQNVMPRKNTLGCILRS